MPNTDMSKQTLTLFQEQQLSRAKLQDKPHATLTVLKPTACTDQVPFSFPSFCRKIFFSSSCFAVSTFSHLCWDYEGSGFPRSSSRSSQETLNLWATSLAKYSSVAGGHRTRPRITQTASVDQAGQTQQNDQLKIKPHAKFSKIWQDNFIRKRFGAIYQTCNTCQWFFSVSYI